MFDFLPDAVGSRSGGGAGGFGDVGFYSPDEVIVLIGGIMPARLLSDETFVTVSKTQPAYTSQVSTDGLITRTKTTGSLYEVRLTLLNGSPTNDTLQALFTVDEATGRGKFPLLIKNNLGGDMFFATNSWIEEIPPMEFSTEEGVKEWVIRCGYGVYNLGGSDEFSSGVMGTINDFLKAGSVVADIIGGN